jgi:hypothetical protein
MGRMSRDSSKIITSSVTSSFVKQSVVAKEADPRLRGSLARSPAGI